MPPKPKPKAKAKEEPVLPPSEFDALDTETLKRLLGELRGDTDRVARERAEAQVDRDSVERFFDVTKRELREVELGVLAKEREMEVMAENHRVEVRVYSQKVKALEYEHAHGMRKLTTDETATLAAEDDAHMRREATLRAEKTSLRSRLREAEEANAEAVRAMKALHEKSTTKLRQEFQLNLEQLRAKYETRLAALVEDLQLRRKVEVHEVEERKNLHINQLMKAHDDAFAEMKRYYNDITRANLQLITQLRAQIAEANEKVAANQKLMREIADQNTKLRDPLEAATRDLATLQAELKDADKDRQSLKYAKARLASLRGQIAALEKAHVALEKDYAAAERDRDELYDKFSSMVEAARARSEAKNEALEKRLATAEYEYATRKAQVTEVLVAAKLDPSLMSVVNARLDSVLESRNQMISQLQRSVAMLTKAHNDAQRVFDAKMRHLSIPTGSGLGAATGGAAAGAASGSGAYDMGGLGGALGEILPSATGVGPAGLVAKPSLA